MYPPYEMLIGLFVRFHRYCILILTIILLSLQSQGQQQIVINELGIAPTANNSGGGSEFVELFNKSGCSVNIGCYVVVFSSSNFVGSNGWTITIPANTILPSNGIYLIGGGGAGNAYPIGPWQNVPVGGSIWKNLWGANGKDIADLDISTSSNSAFNTIPGLLTDKNGQVTLLKPTGVVEASVSYNLGNQSSSYVNSFTNSGTAGCSQIKPLPSIPNSPTDFNKLPGGFTAFSQGIYLDNTGTYQIAFNNLNPNLTPGKPNVTQLASSPAMPGPTVSVTQQPSCTSTTGTITITAPAAAGNTFSIDGTNYQSSMTFNSVAPGNYNVTFKDASGCTSAATPLTVNTIPSGPTAPAGSTTQPTCGTSTGTITLSSPSGAGFTYSINGTTYQASLTFSGLTQGNYNATVKDAGGCISNATAFTINNVPTPPSAPSGSVIQPTCSTSTGTITLSTPTGIGLTYSINGTTYQASMTFSGLNPGSYNATVKDAGGCISNVTAFTINNVPTPPNAPTGSVTQQPTCSTPTGTITLITPTGAGLTYSINGTTYQASMTFSGLNPGSYNATVKDAGGCISNATAFTISNVPTPPSAPTGSVTQQPTCTTPTGTITITNPSGAGYTYSINGTNYQASMTFNNVSPGSYNATVKDAGGCTSSAITIVVNGAPSAPAAPTGSVTQQPTCSTPTGTITLTGPSGAGYLYSINGTTYQASMTFNNVSPGSYNATVKDAGGCISNATPFIISNVPAPPSAPTGIVTQPTCSTTTGTITLSAPTGAGLTYSINGITYQSSLTFSGLSSGSYNATVKDAGGCISNATPFTISNVPAPPSAPTGSVTQPTCSTSTGTITLSAPTGAGLTYSINGTTYQSSMTFNSVTPGSYNVTVKDAGGCTSSATTIVVNGAPSAPGAPAGSVTQQPTCSTPTGTITLTNPSGAGYTYSINGTNYQALMTFNNVSPGSYNVTVKDAGGCTSNATTIVVNGAPSAPNAPTGSVIQQPTCSTPTGTITLTNPSGAGYTYSINGTNYQASMTFNNVSPGSYNATVRDAGGCTSGATTIVVNGAPSAPNAPTGTVTQQPTCSTPTGTITLSNPTGGGYTYSINGIAYQASMTFNNVSPGSYNATVKDAGGCTSNATTIVVNAAPSAPSAPIGTVIQQPTCSTPTGTITLSNPTGTEYLYSINGTNYQASMTFNNVSPGSYNATVRDAGGCTSSATTIVVSGAPSAPNAPTGSVTQQPTCATPTGIITLTGPSGAGYLYSINGATYQSSMTFNNVSPGNYNATVKDAGGCTSSATTIVVNGAPAVPSAPTGSVTQQPTCSTPTGTITITNPSGAGYTYSINGVTYQTSMTFNNVSPGSYNATVRDTGGCTSGATTIVVNGAPSAPNAPTGSVTQQPSCSSPTGTITLNNPSGAGYLYSINGTNYQASMTFNNVSPGSYNATVRDAGGCTSNATTIVVNGAPSAPSAPTGSATQQPTCSVPTGTITLSNPSSAGYTYSINGTTYQASMTFNNVNPGSYNTTVRDAAGCTSGATTIVVNGAPSAPNAPTGSVTQQPTCSTPTGTITLSNPTSAGYLYSINGTTYQASMTFNNVSPGSYNATVRDAGGCTSSATTIVVSGAPSAPYAPTGSVTQQPTCSAPTGTITLSNPSGAGYLYSINGTNYQSSMVFTSVSPGSYNATVKDAGGCTSGATTIVVSGGPSAPNAPTGSVTQQPSCNVPTGTITLSAPTGAGLTYSINGTNYQASMIFNGVTPGSYNTTVKDAGGCTSSASVITVNNATSTATAPTGTVQQPTCTNATGSITITSPTGSSYSYSIDGSNYQSSLIFNTLKAGNYNVTVKDAGGCTSSPTMISINNQPTAPSPIRYTTVNTLANTSTQLSARKFVGDEKYNWNPGIGLDNYTINNPVFNFNKSTEYKITISLSNECTVIDTVLIKIDPVSNPSGDPEIYVPSGFSPNMDGRNDKLIPHYRGMKEIKYFKVYNRFGQLIFESSKEGVGWDGNYKGELQKPDIFIWVAQAISNQGVVINRKGTTVLIR